MSDSQKEDYTSMPVTLADGTKMTAWFNRKQIEQFMNQSKPKQIIQYINSPLDNPDFEYHPWPPGWNLKGHAKYMTNLFHELEAKCKALEDTKVKGNNI